MNAATAPTDADGDVDAIALQAARQVDDPLCEGRQIGAEALEQFFELRDHENEQDAGDDDGDRKHRRRVEQRLLHFLLEGFGLFLVRRDLVEQRFQRTGLFAGFDQVHEQIVEMQRVFGEGFMQ